MRLKALSRHKLTSRTLFFLILATFALVIGLSTLEPLKFLNLPGLLVVVLGTLGVALLSHSLDDCMSALKQFNKPNNTAHQHIANEANIILHFAQLWFRNQYIQIDRDLAKLDKPFLKKGLQMIRDRQSQDDILALLNWQISQVSLNEGKLVAVFRTMANTAPALGIVGTVIALFNMVYLLEQGTAVNEAIGLLGFALVSTFYGLLFSNFIFKPMTVRLENRKVREVRYITLLAEGILLIHQKSTPAVIRETLMTLIETMEGPIANEADSPLASQKGKKPMLLKFGLQRSS